MFVGAPPEALAHSTQGSLLARRLGEVPLGLLAHRCYLERRDAPKGRGDLQHHVIGADRNPVFLTALGALGGDLTRRGFRLCCDSDAAQLSALRSGLGIAVCQTGIAARDADLVPVLAGEIAFNLNCWLVMHHDLRAVRRVRLVHERLGNELPRLFGRTPQA